MLYSGEISDDVVCLSDPHLAEKTPSSRTDNILETSIKKMDRVLGYSEKMNSLVLIPGDLTDKPRLWYILDTLIYNFTLALPRIIAVAGQHDKYFRTDNATILTILRTLGMITLADSAPIELTTKSGKKIAIYGCGWGEEVPEPEKTEDIDRNILLIHAPLSLGDKPFEVSSAKAFLKKWKEKYHLISFGDIHVKCGIEAKRKDGDKCVMVNSGPLIRKEFTEDMVNHSPGFWIYNISSQKYRFKKIRVSPAEEVFSAVNKEVEKRGERIKEFSKKLIGIRNKKTDIRNRILEAVKENKIKKGVIKILDEVMEEK